MKKYILLLLSIILLIVSCQKNPTAEQIFNKYMEIVQSGEYDRIKKIDSRVIITTHSPYILSAFNNLILANNTAIEKKERKKDIEKIISEDK